MHPFRPASALSVSRFDEGYSEDTRSQSGSDMAMRNDGHLTDADWEPDSPLHLPDWVLALSDHERSGECRHSELLPPPPPPPMLTCRLCLCHPAIAQDLFHSQHSRETQPSPASRPRHTPATRNHLPDPLLPQSRDPAARLNALASLEIPRPGQPLVEATLPARRLELQLPPNTRI